MGLLRKDRKFDSSSSTTRAKPFIQSKDSPVDPFFKPVIQTKLKVGKSNDKFEQEADRVADRVVNKSKGDAIQKKGGEEEIQQKPIASEVTPLVQKSEASEEEPVQKSAAEEEKVQKQEEEEAVQTKGESEEESVQMMEEEEAVQAKGEEEESVQMQEEEEAVQSKKESVQKQEEEEAVQTKRNGARNASSSIESRLNNSKGGGQKLSGKTKYEMESGFGSDFSNVNIHTDENAAQLSKDLGAKAFAHGNDIYFNKGQYNPESSAGKHLLAHELTHTIQQKGMVQKKVQRQQTSQKSQTTQSAKWVTDDLKRKIAATMLAESYKGQEKKIRWIYYNRVLEKKGESGLNGSSAYKHKHRWYKIWLFLLGDTTYGGDSLPDNKEFKGFPTIKDFCTKNGYMTSVAAKRSREGLKLIDDMFKTGVKNPYSGWKGQGNLDDFNNVSNNEVYWKKARAYYWLQVNKKVTANYVEKLEAGSSTQFIFNADKINEYWKSHQLPTVVPKV